MIYLRRCPRCHKPFDTTVRRQVFCCRACEHDYKYKIIQEEE